MSLFTLIPIHIIIIILPLINTENPIINIPEIPNQHVVCWYRSLSKSIQIQLIDSCRNNNFSILQFNDKFGKFQFYLFDLIFVLFLDGYKTKFCKEIQYLFENQKPIPCWGYESDANEQCLLYKPSCIGSSQSWASDYREQWNIFFNTADFGYVKQQKSELDYYCLPNISYHNPGYLKCSKFMRYCQAENLYIDFKNLVNLKEPIRYREDILKYGDIGAWNCDLSRQRLLSEGSHKSPLMSWFSEISNFKSIFNVEKSKKCDLILNRPTFIMKLDATINMYHHFCDFVNLYLSFHINGTFNFDNNILIWDTYPYNSNFSPVWKAFTNNKIMNLSQFKGKIICFKNVIFPLLPRMIYGLYYNMPLIPGCANSGIFRAFNRHLLFHLQLKNSEDLCSNKQIFLTFLSRNTKYRKVLNQNQLIQSLKEALNHDNQTDVTIQLVDFNHQMPFIDQVKISSISDILIGIHGAGLTHTLFQPDYGILFELYNCGDQDCYRDLARLRGVHYITWEKLSKLKSIADDTQKADQLSVGGAHGKFVNYKFDRNEFVQLTLNAIELLRKRKANFCTQINQIQNENIVKNNKLKDKLEL